MGTPDLLAGLVILVGIAGIVVPVLPGSLLVLAAVIGWAIAVGGPTAWATAGVVTLLLAVGGVLKYTVPGKHLSNAGVPNRSIVIGTLAGFAGFFVIPVVGLFVGFVLGVYASEFLRVGHRHAWPSTALALKATGFSVLIELTAAMLAATVFVLGAVAT
ncbi:MAG: DUF456 domain-containing protein [Nocardioidaceae bacterium]